MLQLDEIQEKWRAIITLRGTVDYIEYMHVILGLLFIKLNQNTSWSNITSNQPNIGQIIDDTISNMEKENPIIKDMLIKNYAKLSPKLPLNKIIFVINDIDTSNIFEYFISKFAGLVGKSQAKFYTPRTITKLLINMIQPHGTIYDPCCGIGMLHTTHNKKLYGQESDYTIWKLAKMNLLVHDMDTSQIIHGDSLHNDQHDIKADFIISDLPFNVSKYGCEKLYDNHRWVYGNPPNDNANFAWIQHVMYHLSTSGVAGIVLANGTMASSNLHEYKIRRKLVEANLIDCIVALPGQLFYSTQIPSCLWVLTKKRNKCKMYDILFVDARSFGKMDNPTHRFLTNAEIQKISQVYHLWQNKKGYKNIANFCKSVNLDDVHKQDFKLVPNCYVDNKQMAHLVNLDIEKPKAQKLNYNMEKSSLVGDSLEP